MAELVNEKKIEGISHIQDESDKSGMRLVIELKRGEVPEVVLNNLYKQTQLQDTFGINMVALIDGQPTPVQPEGPDPGLPAAPPRSGHAPHGVQPAQGARARPRAGRPGRRAGQHRRIHRDHPRIAPTPPVAKAELMSRAAGTASWCARCSPAPAPTAASINADDYRPEGLERELRHGRRRPVPPVRHPGPGNPADAPAAPDRPGAGQDRRRIQGGDGRDRGPARHPGQAGARVHHHQRRTRRAEAGVRPDQAGRPPQPWSSTTPRTWRPRT